MRDLDGNELAAVGITTGKVDVFDSGATDLLSVPVNPGGIPIYRGGKVIGGVGVAGVSPELAEYAATLAAAGAGRGLDFSEPLGMPGAVFIDGIRVPFFGACTNIPCIRAALRQAPPGTSSGRLSDGRFLVPPRSGQQAPEGYLARAACQRQRLADRRRGQAHHRPIRCGRASDAGSHQAADQPAGPHGDGGC